MSKKVTVQGITPKWTKEKTLSFAAAAFVLRRGLRVVHDKVDIYDHYNLALQTLIDGEPVALALGNETLKFCPHE